MDERFTIVLPGWVWKDLASLAKERGCSTNDVLVDQVGRMITEPEFHRQMQLKLDAFLRDLNSGKYSISSWPQDALDAAAIGALLSIFLDTIIEKEIEKFSEEDMNFWDQQVKATGRTLESLLYDRIFGLKSWEDHDKADWWKDPPSESK